MKTNIYLLLFTAILSAGLVARAEVRRSTLEKRIVRSMESFENVANSRSGGIPPSVLARAQGILIQRQYGASFMFGGKGGFGVVMAKDRNGNWSAPAFLGGGEGSFGLQIGVQNLDLVFLFMNRDSMKMFERSKFRIGVDAAAAAGPIGANKEAKLGAPVLVYSDNAGLYIGASFEGGLLVPDKDANESFYNSPGVSVPEILNSGRIPFPAVATSLRQAIENHAKIPDNVWEASQEKKVESTNPVKPDERPYDRSGGPRY